MKRAILVVINLLLFNVFSFGQNNQPEDIINKAVLLKHSAGTGSGLLISFDSSLYLVTARHVILKEINKIYQYKDSNLEVTSYASSNDSNRVTIININLFDAEKSKNTKFYTDRDLVIIKIATAKKGLANFLPFVSIIKESPMINPFMLHEGAFLRFKEAKILTDIIIVGFPTSLGRLNQYDFFTPIIRRGFIAGKNLTKKTLVLDCPVFPGNSGGPAFASASNSEIMQLLGIVTEFIPLADTWQSSQFEGLTHVFLENSGYSVVEPMDYIIDLIKQLK